MTEPEPDKADRYQDDAEPAGSAEPPDGQPGRFQAGGASAEGEYGYRDAVGYPEEQPGGSGEG